MKKIIALLILIIFSDYLSVSAQEIIREFEGAIFSFQEPFCRPILNYNPKADDYNIYLNKENQLVAIPAKMPRMKFDNSGEDGHIEKINAFSFGVDTDGTDIILISKDEKNNLCIWTGTLASLMKITLDNSFADCQDFASSVAISGSTSNYAFACKQNIYVKDWMDKKKLKTLPSSVVFMQGLKFSEDGKYLVAYQDGSLKSAANKLEVWDIEKETLVYKSSQGILASEVTAEGIFLYDGKNLTYQTYEGKVLKTLALPMAQPNSVVKEKEISLTKDFDNQFLYIVDRSGKTEAVIYRYDIAQNAIKGKRNIAMGNPINFAACFRDGKYIHLEYPDKGYFMDLEW